jgi:hypothetical protein
MCSTVGNLVLQGRDQSCAPVTVRSRAIQTLRRSEQWRRVPTEHETTVTHTHRPVHTSHATGLPQYRVRPYYGSMRSSLHKYGGITAYGPEL